MRDGLRDDDEGRGRGVAHEGGDDGGLGVVAGADESTAPPAGSLAGDREGEKRVDDGLEKVR